MRGEMHARNFNRPRPGGRSGPVEEQMARQVRIDTEECIGCETCVELCPDIFAFDEEAGKSHVIKAEGGDEACIEEAIAACPAECITYE